MKTLDILIGMVIMIMLTVGILVTVNVGGPAELIFGLTIAEILTFGIMTGES